MAAFDTYAGAVLGISATLPATHDAAGFGLLTFTSIGLVESLGEYGKDFNLVTFNPLDTRATLKAKGSYDNGGADMVYAIKATDGGQVIVKAAADSDDSYALSFTRKDGAIDYNTGIIMNAMKSNGSTDDVFKGTSRVEFDNDFIEVAAP